MRRSLWLTIFLWVVTTTAIADSLCKGNFVNPITDVCWDCLFPITIGNATVVSGDYPDTSNPSLPVCICPTATVPRIGLTIGYWEPLALADVTRIPYCLVNLGGVQLPLGSKTGIGGSQINTAGNAGAFYYVHWYKYPLMAWLNIITSLACFQQQEFDIAYLAELDPLWNDDELSFLINPEAILFGNPIAQAACAADAIATITGKPIDTLFWCAGSHGSMYPLTGYVIEEPSFIQSATLLVERMDFKLHRQGMIADSVGKNFPAVCSTYHSPIMPKSRYRYQMVNRVADSEHCHPFGHLVSTWELGHHYPGEGNNYGFLVWQKRNCCFL